MQSFGAHTPSLLHEAPHLPNALLEFPYRLMEYMAVPPFLYTMHYFMMAIVQMLIACEAILSTCTATVSVIRGAYLLDLLK